MSAASTYYSAHTTTSISPPRAATKRVEWTGFRSMTNTGRTDMCTQCISKSAGLRGVGRTGLGAGSAAVALFIPKCPLCVAAWAGALSALGIDFDRWEAIKWPVTAAFLLLAALLLGA